MEDSDQFRVLEMNCSSISMDEEITDEDVKDKIEPLIQSISEKIKLLSKQLADTTVKKLVLLKQFDEITNLEEQLQKTLREEMSKERKIKAWMTERQIALNMDVEPVTHENDDFVKKLLALEAKSVCDYKGNKAVDNDLCLASVFTDPVTLDVVTESLTHDNLFSEDTETLKIEVNHETEDEESAEQLDWSKSQNFVEVSVIPEIEQSVEPDAGGKKSGGKGNYKQRLKCPKCNKVCMRKDHLQRHIERGCKDLTYDCTECNRQFTCTSNLKAHARTHSAPPAEELEFSKDLLKLKVTRKPRKDSEALKCPKCSKCYKRKDCLENHIKRMCKDTTYPCDKCYRKFNHSTNLKLHYARKHSMIPIAGYQCKKCSKRLMTLYTYKRHLRLHEGHFTHLCPTCGKGYVDVVALNFHIVGKHTPRQFKCDICNKRYLSEKYLQKHRRIHTGEFESICASCGKTFTMESMLRSHMMIHNAKAYKCTVCAREFHTGPKLKVHMRKHTREKAFSCIECIKKFYTKFQLEKHMRNEHGIVPPVLYDCTECNRQCSSFATLETHKKTHMNVKSHQCNECNRQYRSKYDLTYHKRKMHSSESSLCVAIDAN